MKDTASATDVFQQTMQSLQRQNDLLTESLKQAHRRIEYLSNQVVRLTRAQGTAFDESGQGMFEFADPVPAQVTLPPANEAAASGERKGRHGRRRLAADLVTERREHLPEAADLICADCGKEKVRIGEEVSRSVDYTPAVLKIIEDVQVKFACKDGCEGSVSCGPAPERVIDKCMAEPGLLAAVVAAKFGEHKPTYRLEEHFEQRGLRIARSTMCDWVGRVAELLSPVHQAIKVDVLMSPKIHTDDTTVQMLDPGNGETKTTRLWIYVDAKGQACFDFTLSRNRDGPAKFLSGYSGYLQADAYGGYDGIFVSGAVKEVACWAHSRRKIQEALDKGDTRAIEGLAFIRMLYDVEDSVREAAPEKRYAARQERSLPILQQTKAWLDARSQDVLPKSPLGTAVRYCQNQWAALMRYTEDGILEPDNNIAERGLRRVAIGRKNWMFFGSEAGGQRASVLFTLIAGCKLMGHDPWVYLKDVLVRISHHPARLISDLTPLNWKPQAASK